MEGLIRVATAVPHLHLGNVEKNVEVHLAMLREAVEKHASLVVFPELSLTGYTCGDLFLQQSLQAEVLKGIRRLMDECPEGLIAVVGAPLMIGGGNVNAAVVITHSPDDDLVYFTQKQYLPNNSEFYEKRWFDPAPVKSGSIVALGGIRFPGGRRDPVCGRCLRHRTLRGPVVAPSALQPAGAARCGDYRESVRLQ